MADLGYSFGLRLLQRLKEQELFLLTANTG